LNYRWERGVGLARKTQNKKKFKQQSAVGSGAATIEAVGGGVVSESSPGMLSKRRFSNRTLYILILLLIPLAYLSFRSIRVYQLRSMAFEASELRNAGKWRTLEPLAVKWGEADPTTSIPWLYAAECAEKLGSPDRMAQYLERIPSDDPQAPDLLLELATIYFGPLNRPQQGVIACERAIELAPEHREARRRLIFYYGITMQREKVIEATREAIRVGVDTQETYVYLIGANWLSFSNAYELNGKWLQSGSNDEVYGIAEALHWRGATKNDPSVAQLPEADRERIRKAEQVEMLKKYLARFPKNHELLAYFLEESSVRGDMEEVENLLAQVPASAANDNRFWHYKGWFHANLSEWEEAEKCYRKALELHPYAWRSQFDLADVLRKSGQLEQVERWSTLSLEGKDLQKTILQLPDVQSVPMDVFKRMQRYASNCGDTSVAGRMLERIQQFGVGEKFGQ
jgi:tetratricopeptide (TPR) repeat protein